MDFAKAREKYLAEYDEVVAALRKLVAEKGWCNPDWKPFKEQYAELEDVFKKLMRLGEVESEATK